MCVSIRALARRTAQRQRARISPTFEKAVWTYMYPVHRPSRLVVDQNWIIARFPPTRCMNPATNSRLCSGISNESAMEVRSSPTSSPRQYPSRLVGDKNSVHCPFPHHGVPPNLPHTPAFAVVRNARGGGGSSRPSVRVRRPILGKPRLEDDDVRSHLSTSAGRGVRYSGTKSDACYPIRGSACGLTKCVF